MQNFTLGERVEAPNALDLPLDLAVALLTDSQGRINVAVPVTGNVDNPQFSYRHLIREALAQPDRPSRQRAVPGARRLFGGDAEALGSIEFEPGRARLLPPEREKLDKVAQVLKEKPQLKLVVRGAVRSELDGEALREPAGPTGGRAGARGEARAARGSRADRLQRRRHPASAGGAARRTGGTEGGGGARARVHEETRTGLPSA